jgi:DNA polymerase-3 subunit delta'
VNAPYPWLEQHWHALAHGLAGNTLGHAYLVSGAEGLGKYEFATAFARLVLCEARVGDNACDRCRSCALVAAGNHPDLRILVTEEDKKRIVIDQVRSLIDYYALKPHYQSRKIAIIYPAEIMNGNAANALLKILEEPPAGALILLLSHRPGQLTQTTVSRCQKINLELPDWNTCIDWLESERAGGEAMRSPAGLTLAGAPLDIRNQLLDPDGPPFDTIIDALGEIAAARQSALEAARSYTTSDIRRFLDAVDLVIRAMVELGFGQRLRHLHISAQRQQHLQEIANKLNSKRLFFFLDQIASARAVVLRSSGVRSAEVIENLFYCWAKVTQSET